MVIQHELAHIQRRDVLLGWVSHFACSLSWFNPLIWILDCRCKVEREQACDDRVLNLGVPATDYGACLLEISESLSGKSRNLRGAIALTEPPLKRRLAMILSSTVSRKQLPLRSVCLVLCVAVFAVLLLSSFRPIGNAANATQPSQQPDKTDSAIANQQTPTKTNSEAVGPILTEIPKQVFGRITSPDGKPISGASLQLKWAQRVATPDDEAIETEDKHDWKVESDANGDFSIDTSLIGKMHQEEWVQLWSVTADGFVLRHPIWLNAKDLAAGKRFEVKMLKGRKVKAQIVGSDRAPLSGAVIKAAGNDGDPNNGWWSYGDAADAAGKCSIEVPVDMDIEWIVYGKGHAPKRVKVGRDESDLGTIQLEKGARVFGKVLDEAGQPVSGTVVRITMHDGCELTSMAFGAEYATLTDENGMYSLIPFLGKCTVSTSSMGRDLSTLGEPVIKGKRGLVMLPLELNLDSTKDSVEVNLTQGPTAIVKGQAKWDSGSTVVGMRIKGGAMFNPIGVELTNTKTDANGKYELRLPIPLDDAYVNAIGEKDASGVFYMAHAEAPAPAIASRQYISFQPLTKNVIEANWTLKKYESPVLRASNQSDGDKALEELRKQQSKMAQDLAKAWELAKSPQEQAEVNKKIDPRNHFAPRYLAMEEKYRGTDAALQALSDVMTNARSTGDEASAAALGRIEAVDRLIAFYLSHEQLGQTFRALTGGPEVPRAYEFLEAAYDQSPHSSVKMAALIAQIDWAKSQLRIADNVEEIKKVMDALQKPLAAQHRQYLEASVKAFQSLDAEKIRDETNKKLDILANQYGNEPIQYYGNGLSAAQSFRNAINNIVVGRAVSQIEALDVNKKVFRLSDQVGKVVLLLFAEDMADNYATRYEPFREFIAKYKNKNVVVVGMMGNDKLEQLAAAAKKGHLPWNVIPQPLSSKFLRDWGVDVLPSFYVVDQKGKLQGTYSVSANPMTGYSLIEETIDKLLSESETQPSK